MDLKSDLFRQCLCFIRFILFSSSTVSGIVPFPNMRALTKQNHHELELMLMGKHSTLHSSSFLK